MGQFLQDEKGSKIGKTKAIGEILMATRRLVALPADQVVSRLVDTRRRHSVSAVLQHDGQDDEPVLGWIKDQVVRRWPVERGSLQFHWCPDTRIITCCWVDDR